MKTTLSLLALCLLLMTACSSVKVHVPGSLQDNAEKLHVKGTSISVFGHKIKVDGFGEGRMYSGFTSTSGTDKRLFPLYFDLDSRMNYISNHFSKQTTRSKTKFNFEFTNKQIYANTYCVVHSSESSIASRTGWGVQLSEDYRFSGLIYTNQSAKPWRVEFAAQRDIRDGWDNYTTNTRHSNGVLTNDDELIAIKMVRIKTMKEDTVQRNTLFPIVAGYEFMQNDRRLAFVDIFDQNIWIDKNVDELTRMILVSAATSILVKNNAG